MDQRERESCCVAYRNGSTLRNGVSPKHQASRSPLYHTCSWWIQSQCLLKYLIKI